MERKFGILMPIFSLDGKEGIGTFGESARDFVDFLSECGVSYWQILPLCPIGCGGSPYSSPCGDGINPYFIDLKALVDKQLLKENEIASLEILDFTRVNYDLWADKKISLLKKAFSRYSGNVSGYMDYAIFMAIKESLGGTPYYEWGKLSDYNSQAVKDFCSSNQEEISFWQFVQMLAHEQWSELKEYANHKGVSIIGDMPFYVSLDSVEVWTNKEMFELDGYVPTLVAGVPPDYFSETGQLWGNPIYKLNEASYEWWNDRISSAMNFYDVLRLDHFRAFDEYYTIPYGSEDATKGEWKKGMGYEFFAGKKHLPMIAEDLGIITDSVRKLLAKTGYPGMRVLQFGFDGNSNNPHLASNIGVNCVCYTGTHDNMTLAQFLTSLDDEQLSQVIAELNKELSENLRCEIDELVDAMIELGCSTDARLFIVPMADLMRKGREYRINTPSTVSELNWSVRIKAEDIKLQKERIKALLVKYNRMAKNNLTN